MAEPTSGLDLGAAAALLAAGVIAVPVFKRVGLGSVLGYLAAGLAIGPFGLKLFREPETILHVAEFGVVIFLFIIGLEMRPKRLWGLRKEIFGLGAAQVLFCGFILTLTAMLAGFSAPVAFVGAMGFVLSSTAVIMQMLEERGAIAGGPGQRAVSILLLEDLAIVPLLAVVAVLASILGVANEQAPPLWQTVGFAVAAVGGVLLAGKYLVNPIFRLLARYGGREVMTAAALLVVVGAAWAMSLGGLSMAMGAFLAGVLLSESSFRHQLEADVEPFRAILLGLFFLSVGMSLDLSVVVADWRLVVGGVVAFMAVKALGLYAVARLFKASHHEAVERAALFAQGGEFAFVLYGAAVTAGLFDVQVGAMMSAIVILSMALTPLTSLLTQRLLPKPTVSAEDADGVEFAKDLRGQVLIIGFGRFAQVVSQPLLARDVDVSIIENDVEMIQAASQFGFKVYYGDGTRLDILHAAGASHAAARRRPGQIRTLDGDTELFEGFRVLKVPSHTPGMQVPLLRTSKGVVAIASDLGDHYRYWFPADARATDHPQRSLSDAFITGNIRSESERDWQAAMRRVQANSDIVVPAHDFRIPKKIPEQWFAIPESTEGDLAHVPPDVSSF